MLGKNIKLKGVDQIWAMFSYYTLSADTYTH